MLPKPFQRAANIGKTLLALSWESWQNYANKTRSCGQYWRSVGNMRQDIPY